MKLTQSGSTSTMALIGIVVVALIGIGVWQSGIFDDEAEVTTNQSTSQESELPVDETSTDDDEVSTSMLVGPELVEDTREEAILSAVGDYTGSGTATNVDNTDGDTIHEVVASLDEPAEGKFYEGWVVGPSVISTGALESEGDGEWSLIFTTNQDISAHDRVVITEETLANGLDGVPEDHVLEGSF